MDEKKMSSRSLIVKNSGMAENNCKKKGTFLLFTIDKKLREIPENSR